MLSTVRKINVAYVISFLLQTAVAMGQPAGTFRPAGNMTTARSGHTATLLADGRVLLACGGPSNAPPSAELYDPSTGTFTPTGAPNTCGNVATLLADGRVLIIGRGLGYHSASGGSSGLYDTSKGTVTATGNATAPYGCSAALLNNGKVLLVDDPPPYGTSETAQLYDPDTGTFVPTGAYASIDMARFDKDLIPSYGGWDCRPATLLQDGRVLVAGGIAAEIYDPATNTFSLTGTLTALPNGIMRTFPPTWIDPSKTVLLLNGTVLFTGGDDDSGPEASAWLYDPATGTFSDTGNMATRRADHTVTLLPDGTVLAAGSFHVCGYLGPNTGAFAGTELYDPAGRVFTSLPDMIVPRFNHAATLLTDGRVLITGGTTGEYQNPGYSSPSSTEIYTPARLRPAPALLSLSGDGRGQGAILHAGTAQVTSSAHPASAGELLEIYLTGLSDGGVIPPQVTVSSRMAEVLWFGKAPGFADLNQVNVRVPAGVAPGTDVPVRLMYLGRHSNEVTICVQ